MNNRKVRNKNTSLKSGKQRKGSLLSTVGNTSQVKKNEGGGIYIDQSDIGAFMDFFGTKEGNQKHLLTIDLIKTTLEKLFGPDASQFLSNRELRQLMNGKRGLSQSDIESLLLNNNVSNKN